MKNEFSALRYYNFRRSIILLLFLGLVIPVIHLLTLEYNESVNIRCIVVPIIISWITVLAVSVSRKVLLGNLIAHGMDFGTVYELEKRKPNEKNKYYNLRLLSNIYFFSGDFQNLQSCLHELLESSEEKDVCYARHLQIISLFITGEHKDIPGLIRLQEEIMPGIKKSNFQEYSEYYSFIKFFMKSEYDNAISVMNKQLSQKNIEILNHKKVLIYYFLRMAYLSLGDAEKVQNCTNEIVRCDPKHTTFFSRY